MEEDLRNHEDYAIAVKELYYWQYGTDSCGERPTNFDSKLFELIGKADSANKRKLRKGFPYHVLVYSDWQNCSFSELPTFYDRYVSNEFQESVQGK